MTWPRQSEPLKKHGDPVKDRVVLRWCLFCGKHFPENSHEWCPDRALGFPHHYHHA